MADVGYIYLKNNRAKFYPNPISNSRALGFLKGLPQQEEKKTHFMELNLQT